MSDRSASEVTALAARRRSTTWSVAFIVGTIAVYAWSAIREYPAATSVQNMNIALLVTGLFVHLNVTFEILPRNGVRNILVLYPVGFWVVLLCTPPWLSLPVVMGVQITRALRAGGGPTVTLANISAHLPAMCWYMVVLKIMHPGGLLDLHRSQIPSFLLASVVGLLLLALGAALVYPRTDLRTAFTPAQVAGAAALYLLTACVWSAWPPLLLENIAPNAEFVMLVGVLLLNAGGVVLAHWWQKRYGNVVLTPQDTPVRPLRQWRSWFRLSWSAMGLTPAQQMVTRREVARFNALTTLMEQSSDGFGTLNGAGVITSWNQTMETWSGVESVDVVGRPLESILPLDGRDEFDWYTIGRDGQERVIAIRVMRMPATSDDQEAGMSMVMGKDVTEHVRRDTVRNQYVAMVSHELASPLMAIELGVEMALGDTEDPDVHSALNDVLQSAEQMNGLLADLDVTARVVTLGVASVEFIMQETPVQEVVAAGTPAAFLRSSRVHVNKTYGDTLVRCDLFRARQVITNLLSNAEKYSPHAQPIDVSFTPTGSDVSIAVSDRGDGLPEEDVETVFKQFVRGTNTGTARGAGIGLAVARELATAMGGDLTYMPRPGGGSIFTFTLPRALEDADQSAK